MIHSLAQGVASALYRYGRSVFRKRVGGVAFAAVAFSTEVPTGVDRAIIEAASETGPSLPALLVAGTRAGFEASVVMDLPMGVQSEGFAPAFVAAGALRDRPPRKASGASAAIAHHGAGALGGVLFALAYWVGDRVLRTRSRIDGLAVPAYPLAVGFVLAFVYAFFAGFVLPTVGGEVRERSERVRKSWLLSTLVYAVVLATRVPRHLSGERVESE
jgi:hypothetical protein